MAQPHMKVSHATPEMARTPLRWIQEAVAAIDPQELRTWVEHLSRPRHRIAQARQNYATAEWIAGQLRSWGYTVEIQGPLRNVAAIGPRKPRHFTLIGAHYDSVPATLGADDNASAVASLLACAKVCAPAVLNGSADLVFVAFNGEEDHLLGSRAFVQQMLEDRSLKLRVAHVLEMVGYADSTPGSQKSPPDLPLTLPDRGDFLGLVANRDTGAAFVEALTSAATYVKGFPVVGVQVPHGLEEHFPVLLRSDHASFWEHRLPSMMWTDTSEFRNPYYHTTQDSPETLDYSYLQRVTQVLVASILGASVVS